MENVYVGVGSNMGRKIDNCRNAIDRMGRLKGCSVRARSSFYRTDPVGVEGQDDFINGVVCLQSERSAPDLLGQLLSIETEMGRVRRKKWGARVIDLDILMFGSQIIQTPDLMVPHPLMHTRRFVLKPMAQIAPYLIHPVLCKTIQQLMEMLPEDGQAVEIIEGS